MIGLPPMLAGRPGMSLADSFRFRFSPDRRRPDMEDLSARGEPREGWREKSGGVGMRLRWGVEEAELGWERELRSGGMVKWRMLDWWWWWWW